MNKNPGGRRKGLLEKKIDKTSSPHGCWLWLGKLDKDGYGKYNGERVNRYIFKMFKGPIAKDLLVRHLCEHHYPAKDRTSRRCVNPAHLALGTVKDNSLDSVAALRHASPFKRLSDAQIAEIKTRWVAGESFAALGRAYEVSNVTIRFLIRGRPKRVSGVVIPQHSIRYDGIKTGTEDPR